MIYDIVMQLSYSYASPAVGGRHLVRLIPADLPGRQRLIAGHIDITPTPAERTDRTDFFRNRASDFAFRGGHSRIALKLTARVERHAVPPPPGPSTVLAALRADLARCRDLTPEAPVHFLAPSPLAPRSAAIAAYAGGLVRSGMTTRDAVEALGRAIHDDMRYDPDATEVDTPADEAFADRNGVCQDFSHIMIIGLRALGIPAGYVSGFLRTLPPPGKPRLEGADAMHAWVRAWCGDAAGWFDYDPTNAVAAGEDHVVVAYGRDYGDVAPIKGVLRVSGRQSSKQAVDVIPLPG